jgi:hypothetical protein
MKPGIPDELITRFARLGVRLRCNANRRTVVSLREQRRGPPVLSVHHALLQKTHVLPDLLRFAQEGGHGDYPALREAMLHLPRGPRAGQAALDQDLIQQLPGIGVHFDFEACFRQIHAQWFDHLPRPYFRWGKNPGSRQLRHLRYGAYLRRPHAAVRLSPRLDQPWVARVFVEHVLHHEFCHHAQACDPRPNEAPHSARFRAWEQRYPSYDVAICWEALYLPRMLAVPSGL